MATQLVSDELTSATMAQVPVLSCARHDSRTAPGPAKIPPVVQLLTLKSRKPQAREPPATPWAKPFIEPLRTLARWLVIAISIALPVAPLAREISKPFKSSVTPSALIWIPFVFVTARLVER